MKNLSIHLTDTCNNSCRFCVVNSYQGNPEKVNMKVVEKFLRMNADKGHEWVNIHGGEPTIVPELFNILEKIKELGYPHISIQTNGRAFHDLEFAKETVNRGVDLFVISLHGQDAAMHDYFTQVEGSFDEAVAGIKNIKRLGKKVRTNTCVCKQNIDHLEEIVNLSLDIGTDHINISNLHTTGKAYENFNEVVPTLTDALPAVKRAVDAVVKRGKVVTLEGYPKCVLGDYAKYMIDWNEVNYKLLFRRIILDDYAAFMEKENKHQSKKCKSCILQKECGGLYKEYEMFYGSDEIAPITEGE